VRERGIELPCFRLLPPRLCVLALGAVWAPTFWLAARTAAACGLTRGLQKSDERPSLPNRRNEERLNAKGVASPDARLGLEVCSLPTAYLCKHAPEETWSGNAFILHR
jgi:hypothetical protein